MSRVETELRRRVAFFLSSSPTLPHVFLSLPPTGGKPRADRHLSSLPGGTGKLSEKGERRSAKRQTRILAPSLPTVLAKARSSRAINLPLIPPNYGSLAPTSEYQPELVDQNMRRKSSFSPPSTFPPLKPPPCPSSSFDLPSLLPHLISTSTWLQLPSTRTPRTRRFTSRMRSTIEDTSLTHPKRSGWFER